MKKTFALWALCFLVVLVAAVWRPMERHLAAERWDQLYTEWEDSTSCDIDYDPRLGKIFSDIEQNEQDYLFDMTHESGFVFFRKTDDAMTLHMVERLGYGKGYSKITLPDKKKLPLNIQNFRSLSEANKDFIANSLAHALTRKVSCKRNSEIFDELEKILHDRNLDEIYVIRNACAADFSEKSLKDDTDPCQWIEEKYLQSTETSFI